MTLPIDGPLSLDDINAEFGRGTNLGVYRNTIYYVPPDPVSRRFKSVNLSIQDFYGTAANGTGEPNSVVFGPGEHLFAVPYYTSMKIRIWGGGGGGAASNTSSRTANGGNGGSFKEYDVVFGGLTPGSTEQLYVGYGGNAGAGYDIGYAGEYSWFGGSVFALGGAGGGLYTISGQQPSPYTPPNPRPAVFVQTLIENGGTGASGSGSGGNTVFSGAGGGGAVFVLTTYSQAVGGNSTYGGDGGAGAASVDGLSGGPGSIPGGGGGGAASPASPAGGLGGNGQIYITWTT